MADKYSKKASLVLARAVYWGDEVMLLVALALGGYPDTTCWTHVYHQALCLLSMAAMRGHDHLVPQLIRAGASIDGVEGNLDRPLIMAILGGYSKIVATLIKAGANLDEKGHNGKTALHVAANVGNETCVTLLLAADADINAKDNDDRRPLHHAASANQIGVVQQLLRYKRCDRHARDKSQWTALNLAALTGSMEVVQCLVLGGLDPHTKSKNGLTALDDARRVGHHHLEWWIRKLPYSGPIAEAPMLSLVRMYLVFSEESYEEMLQGIRKQDSILFLQSKSALISEHQQDATGLTLLHWAAKLGQTIVVRHFHEKYKLYPHVLTWAGETPADLARRAGNHHVLKYLQHQQHPQIQGSAEELYDQLLSVITQSDNHKQASALLCSGAPLESPGGCSTQPLPLAITNNRREIVSLLLAAGAPLTTTCHGLNLLTLAWRSPDVTPPVQAIITGVFYHVLVYEHKNMTHLPEIEEGLYHLTSVIRGEFPWQASWPSGRSVAQLTELMVKAARNNCILTCSFIHEAGGQSSLCTESGDTPLHTVLETGHWHLARHMLKNMGGCLYVADSRGRLPTTIMPSHLRLQLEQNIYNKERTQLEELQFKLKDKVDKEQVQELLHLQKNLFTAYWNKITNGTRNTAAPIFHEPFNKAQALLFASQGGMLQLIYLLVKEGGVEVDTEVDPTSGTTALHQAASYGKSGSVLLLQSLGAEPLRRDKYRQTPPHLAAMFCHEQAFQLLQQSLGQKEPSCRAGTTPTDIKNNFSKYLEMYHKFGSLKIEDVQTENNPTDATMNFLNRIYLPDLLKNVQNVAVDYTKGEAKEVKETVMKELMTITEKVAEIDSTYTGTLTLLGSTADCTRLYCPDEFDFNLIIRGFTDVSVTVIKQTEKDILSSGHKLRIEIRSENPSLRGNKLMSNLYDRVRESLENYVLQDNRLSVVPPGVIRTQVGVSLSLAWQGSEYPLLLVDIDLVPVLPITWPKEISRPPLTPTDSQTIHVSNTGDAKWRGSFAATEVEIVKQLDPQERQVFLTGKTLVSCMKAEPWMPRDLKNHFSWWDSRYWNIPIPAGFCFKNSFFIQLQKKREEGIQWKEEDVVTQVKRVFEGMCLEMDGTRRLVPNKVYAYFGGECEKPKVGEGAPHITEFLKKKQ